ncbi:hypothetical protein ACIBK1_39290 [Microbispora rosea]|nr:hypothetical protein [Microbispora rosea]
MTENASAEKSITATITCAKVRQRTGPDERNVTDEEQDPWKHA